MQTSPAVEQMKSLNGPRVGGISPVGKEKVYWGNDLPKSQVFSSEWKTERVREDASGDREDGEEDDDELPCVIGESGLAHQIQISTLRFGVFVCTCISPRVVLRDCRGVVVGRGAEQERVVGGRTAGERRVGGGGVIGGLRARLEVEVKVGGRRRRVVARLKYVGEWIVGRYCRRLK